MNDYRIINEESGKKYVYDFLKPSATTSAFLYCRKTRKFLLVKRKNDPEKGKLAFPGGFINTYSESLEQCVAREVMEETSLNLNPERFSLIDVRSDPQRDERGHVIDHGYFAYVNEELMSNAKAGDDASEIFLANVDDFDPRLLAFDHARMFEAGLRARVFNPTFMNLEETHDWIVKNLDNLDCWIDACGIYFTKDLRLSIHKSGNACIDNCLFFINEGLFYTLFGKNGKNSLKKKIKKTISLLEDRDRKQESKN